MVQYGLARAPSRVASSGLPSRCGGSYSAKNHAVPLSRLGYQRVFMMQAAWQRGSENTKARWQLVSVATFGNALLDGFRQPSQGRSVVSLCCSAWSSISRSSLGDARETG